MAHLLIRQTVHKYMKNKTCVQNQNMCKPKTCIKPKPVCKQNLYNKSGYKEMFIAMRGGHSDGDRAIVMRAGVDGNCLW